MWLYDFSSYRIPPRRKCKNFAFEAVGPDRVRIAFTGGVDLSVARNTAFLFRNFRGFAVRVGKPGRGDPLTAFTLTKSRCGITPMPARPRGNAPPVAANRLTASVSTTGHLERSPALGCGFHLSSIDFASTINEQLLRLSLAPFAEKSDPPGLYSATPVQPKPSIALAGLTWSPRPDRNRQNSRFPPAHGRIHAGPAG